MKAKGYEFDQIFKALGDKHRIQILNMLMEKERNAGELLEAVDVVQSTLSHHMKSLSDSGLVQVRKSGKWTYYSVSRDAVQAAYEFLAQYLEGEGAPKKAAAAVGEASKTPKKAAEAPKKSGAGTGKVQKKDGAETEKPRKKAAKAEIRSHQSENSEDIFAASEEKKEKKSGKTEHEDVFSAPSKTASKKEKAAEKEAAARKEKETGKEAALKKEAGKEAAPKKEKAAKKEETSGKKKNGKNKNEKKKKDKK